MERRRARTSAGYIAREDLDMQHAGVGKERQHTSAYVRIRQHTAA
jgi:hypothetical protein